MEIEKRFGVLTEEEVYGETCIDGNSASALCSKTLFSGLLTEPLCDPMDTSKGFTIYLRFFIFIKKIINSVRKIVLKLRRGTGFQTGKKVTNDISSPTRLQEKFNSIS